MGLHIATDGHRLTFQPRTGVATYLRGLISEWVHNPEVSRLDVLLPRAPESKESDADLLSHPKIRILAPKQFRDPVENYRGQFLWQQNSIPRLLWRSRPDVYFSSFHLTPFLPPSTPIVTTIHDLCFFQERIRRLGKLIHSVQLWSACIRARRLICISRFTLGQLENWSRFFARKAEVVYNGLSGRTISWDDAKQGIRRLCPDLEPRQYLMWVGLLCSRKNPELLFDVFAAHHRRFPNHKFVVLTPFDSTEALEKLAAKRGISAALRTFSGVDPSVRDALYRCALAVVFPSICEGFGYPTLEAMLQGCPAFSGQNTPMEEISKDIVPAVPEPSPESYLGTMERFMTMSESERETLSTGLVAAAQRFSVQAMAEGTLKVLSRAAFPDRRQKGRCIQEESRYTPKV